MKIKVQVRPLSMFDLQGKPGVSLGGQRTDVTDRPLQNTAGTSPSSPFPGSMTTETTVSKGQEFFSPGQTQGVQGEH